MSEIRNKLTKIQSELKAPKGQYNSFGKYRYRSCEDILEAVKPLLAKYNLSMTITDEIVEVGGRVYVKASANIVDNETDSGIINVAYAREEEEKKGMDASQITGTASSYARKYCLNGLFLIDDTKDADTDEYHKEEKKGNPAEKKATEKQISLMKSLCEEFNLNYDEETAKNMSIKEASDFIDKMNKKKEAK